MSWWRRERGPAEDLDRELTELRRDDGSALGALRLVRKRLELGIEDGFERLREHPRWSDVALRHGLDDRHDELVLQTATVDGLVVLKEYVHDESSFDPPGQDDYEYFEYELDVDGRVYEARRYCDDDGASIERSEAIVRDEDAERIARFLVEREGVGRVTRLSRETGAYTRVVEPGPSASEASDD